MSTRSLIAMQIEEDKYRTIYCHSDGYLTYNGAMLLDYYNTPEKVKELIDLGSISFLAKKLNPDPSKPHSFNYDERQEDVVVAYGRDRGEKMLKLKIKPWLNLTIQILGQSTYIYLLKIINGRISYRATPMQSEMLKLI